MKIWQTWKHNSMENNPFENYSREYLFFILKMKQRVIVTFNVAFTNWKWLSSVKVSLKYRWFESWSFVNTTNNDDETKDFKLIPREKKANNNFISSSFLNTKIIEILWILLVIKIIFQKNSKKYILILENELWNDLIEIEERI